MSAKISMKIVSSLEKCFLDEGISSKKERTSYLMYRNEKLSFQVLVRTDAYDGTSVPIYTVAVEGALAPYVTLREMICVPCHYPAAERRDEDTLRTTPGLYPDLLRPLHYRNWLRVPVGQLKSIWVDVQIPEGSDVPKDATELTFALSQKNTKAEEREELGRVTASIRVSDVTLPKQKLIHTEWLYSDCVAEAYRTEVWSEKHWEMMEKYVKSAVDNGVNLIFTPVFTPELDTYIGGERPTTQLVKITVTGKDTYEFDFALLDRWVDMCERLGVDYYEIPHFFTQWGADHAPKFVATVNGEEKRIFGWETDSMGEEYGAFLAQFITALVGYFKKRGLHERCFYHISDEPQLAHLDKYLACKSRVAPYLDGATLIDALSNLDFYESGALEHPVPAIQKIQPFLDAGIDGLWAYYCGANGKPVITGRYMSQPLFRTRILGVQLYRHNIVGFLHWGFNFYHNQYSYDYVDILGNTDGEYFAPSGDMNLVYPGSDDTVWESIRLNAMREAMDDIRALELCESVLGRERTEELISVGTTEPLTFFAYPKSGEYLLSLHDRVLLAVEQAQK